MPLIELKEKEYSRIEHCFQFKKQHIPALSVIQQRFPKQKEASEKCS
ncbi:hypothetical protein [Longirhabdus pacifica]|nr:hypothetical protein [Longirhabdus pacifica]